MALKATIESQLTELGPSQTRVDVVTDLSLSGSVAQYGRGIVQDVAGQMVGKFADCLQKQLVGSEEEAQAAVERASKPVSGLRLGGEADDARRRRLRLDVDARVLPLDVARRAGRRRAGPRVARRQPRRGRAIFWFMRARGAEYA